MLIQQQSENLAEFLPSGLAVTSHIQRVAKQVVANRLQLEVVRVERYFLPDGAVARTFRVARLAWCFLVLRCQSFGSLILCFNDARVQFGNLTTLPESMEDGASTLQIGSPGNTYE